MIKVLWIRIMYTGSTISTTRSTKKITSCTRRENDCYRCFCVFVFVILWSREISHWRYFATNQSHKDQFYYNYNEVIAIKFCPLSDIYPVVACTEICYDRMHMIWVAVKRNLSQFDLWLKSPVKKVSSFQVISIFSNWIKICLGKVNFIAITYKGWAWLSYLIMWWCIPKWQIKCTILPFWLMVHFTNTSKLLPRRRFFQLVIHGAIDS